MLRSIATVSLSGTLEEKLQAAAAARFDAVEIFENDFVCFDGSARQLQSLAADLGLKIALYQPFRDLEGVSDEQFRRNLERAERKFDVMREMGVPLMLVCSNATPQAIDDDSRAAAQLYALADRAALRGLRIGYEALAWGTRVNTYGRAWSLVSRAGHPHLGVILDSYHTLAINDPVQGIADIPGDRIFFVQLADAPRLKMDVLMLSRHFRCFPGQGELDVAAFLAEVVKAGYTGPLSLEVFNDEFRASPTRPTAVDARRSLLFLEEQVRGRLLTDGAAPAKAADPVHRVELFDPPPPPALNGIAFLEFAVDAAAAAALGGALERLGFARVARHRSKAVTLYRQGEANLVLNAEPNSFAHSYFLVHGPSICAIALRAPDERAALSRAEALGCSRFEGRVGPNELTIPAIRSLDGSLIYFVADRAGAVDPLQTDFIFEEGAAPTATVQAIDHVAQALPAGQFDSWVLFYRAVLGLVPDDMWELPDPHGLVRSRAVASANRSVRFPLNISASRNTVTARSVSTFAGAGVHHIAFRCDDVFAAAKHCRDGGVPLLAIPDNYYDDLAARYDLPADLLERLRHNGILYDRGADGEYLQLYTEPFQDRFFFEIVQRVRGYDQYGAANAAVRMAAQTRRMESAAGELIALR